MYEGEYSYKEQYILWKQNAIIQLKINELSATVVPSSPSCSLLTLRREALGLCHILKKLPCIFKDHNSQNCGFMSQG